MFRSKPKVEAFLEALSEGADMFEGRKLHKVLIFFLENSIEGTCIFFYPIVASLFCVLKLEIWFSQIES